MVVSFFIAKGLWYQHMALQKTRDTAEFFITVLTKSLKKFREKDPVMASTDWLLHLDIASCHTATVTEEFMPT